jgi:hypothetical protein
LASSGSSAPAAAGKPTSITFNPRISVSGDYTLASFGYDFGTGVLDTNCSATEFCLITVTFTPTGTGPKHGTLSTGPGGPTATLTGNGVTTPTPPVLPLSLDVSVPELGRRGVVRGITAQTNLRPYYVEGSTTGAHYDTTLVLRGDVKKTTKQRAANTFYKDTIKAKLKHLKRLKEEPTKPRIKIKFTATDEFGQTATDEAKVTLCSRLIRVDREKSICRWHPSRK